MGGAPFLLGFLPRLVGRDPPRMYGITRSPCAESGSRSALGAVRAGDLVRTSQFIVDRDRM